MSRLLGLVVLAVLLWLVLEAAWVRLRLSAGTADPGRRPATRPPEVVATLVRCSGCGVHVPRESVVGGVCERCGPHNFTEKRT
jgi:hypothetical protein